MNLLEWFRQIPVAPWLAPLSVAFFLASVLLFVGSFIALPLVVARMRPDYFLTPLPSEQFWTGRHRGVRTLIIVVKNLAGLTLVVFGIAMLVLPGQGLLTILCGISMLNFPGKRRLELTIARLPPVLVAIGWIRARAGRPPLRFPSGDPSDPTR